jgi:hypothetical protein
MLDRPLLPREGRLPPTPGIGLRLFDDTTVQTDLVALAFCLETQPLPDVRAPRQSGVYGLRYRGRHAAYTGLGDHEPIYVGKAVHLPERLSTTIGRLSEAVDLDPNDFVVWIATASLLHAEGGALVLVGAFDPLWNRVEWRGFGSRPQGGGRSGQRPTEWDRRHPGRSDRTQSASSA